MDRQAERIIQGRDVTLSFGGVRALDAVQFDVVEGEILSLIGPNGAGKTCLLNCITGYYHPERGTLVFKGREIQGARPDSIARMGIARTFQDPTVFPHMTALDILMAARHTHTTSGVFESLVFFGKGRRESLASRRAVEEIIGFTRIQELRKTPVYAMSYGQRKQVEIARALVMKPSVMLLDEPMSGLDDVMKEIITELILDIYREGMTVVLIEHDMQAVMTLSQRIIVLDHGQKIADGKPEDIVRDEQVVRAYFGDGAHAV